MTDWRQGFGQHSSRRLPAKASGVERVAVAWWTGRASSNKRAYRHRLGVNANRSRLNWGSLHGQPPICASSATLGAIWGAQCAGFGSKSRGHWRDNSEPAECPKAGSIDSQLNPLHTQHWWTSSNNTPAARPVGCLQPLATGVEGGKLVAPVNVMRFDDDALRLFGSGLVGLTDAPEFTSNGDTYRSHQLGSITTPAAVVEGFRLTL